MLSDTQNDEKKETPVLTVEGLRALAAVIRPLLKRIRIPAGPDQSADETTREP